MDPASTSAQMYATNRHYTHRYTCLLYTNLSISAQIVEVPKIVLVRLRIFMYCLSYEKQLLNYMTSLNFHKKKKKKLLAPKSAQQKTDFHLEA